MKNLTPIQIIVPAAVAGVLVLAGVGVGFAVQDDDEALPRPIAAGFAGDARGGPGPEHGPGMRGMRGGPGGPRGHHRRLGGGPGAKLGLSPAGLQVLRDIRQAVGRQAPRVAGPILDRAVRERKLTKQQADQIRQHLQRHAQRAQDGPPGPPPPPGGPPPPG